MSGERPNIVWIVADHQAFANRPEVALSFAMQSRLSKQGIRFTQARTVLPICTPARASMLTGKYPHGHGITENDGRFGGRAELDGTDWLVHQPLAEAGYRCGWFGKWHLNHEKTALDYGFEGFSLPGYGYPYATKAYADYLHRKGLAPPIVEIELAGENGRPAGTQVSLCDEADWYDYESGTAILHGPAETHEAYFITDMAQDWIREQGDDPFFVRIDPWGPHPPYMTASPFMDTVLGSEPAASGNLGSGLEHRPAHHTDYRDYWTDTLALDDGQWQLMAQRSLEQAALVEAALSGVLDVLEETGKAQDTIVIYCADHGDAVASNGGVANKGGLMVEETLRIPMLMRGPGIAAGTQSDQLVANIDLAPTLLELCGHPIPEDLQGNSLVHLFNDPLIAHRKGLMLQHYGLHVPLVQRAYYLDHWKIVVQADGFCELYDLETDPLELENLSGSTAHKGFKQQLLNALQSEMVRLGDTGRGTELILSAQA